LGKNHGFKGRRPLAVRALDWEKAVHETKKAGQFSTFDVAKKVGEMRWHVPVTQSTVPLETPAQIGSISWPEDTRGGI